MSIRPKLRFEERVLTRWDLRRARTIPTSGRPAYMPPTTALYSTQKRNRRNGK